MPAIKRFTVVTVWLKPATIAAYDAREVELGVRRGALLRAACEAGLVATDALDTRLRVALVAERRRGVACRPMP